MERNCIISILLLNLIWATVPPVKSIDNTGPPLTINDAIKVLKQVVDVDPSSKISLRKLAQAYDTDDRLSDAAKTFEKLCF